MEICGVCNTKRLVVCKLWAGQPVWLTIPCAWSAVCPVLLNSFLIVSWGSDPLLYMHNSDPLYIHVCIHGCVSAVAAVTPWAGAALCPWLCQWGAINTEEQAGEQGKKPGSKGVSKGQL